MTRLLFVSIIASPVGEKLYTDDGLVASLEKRADDMDLKPGKLEINTTRVSVGFELNGNGTDLCDWIEFAESELAAHGIDINTKAIISSIRSNPGGTVDTRGIDPVNFQLP